MNANKTKGMVMSRGSTRPKAMKLTKDELLMALK